jgi:hypothetical protein
MASRRPTRQYAKEVLGRTYRGKDATAAHQVRRHTLKSFVDDEYKMLGERPTGGRSTNKASRNPTTELQEPRQQQGKPIFRFLFDRKQPLRQLKRALFRQETASIWGRQPPRHTMFRRRWI